jgi:hypothetical protein
MEESAEFRRKVFSSAVSSESVMILDDDDDDVFWPSHEKMRKVIADCFMVPTFWLLPGTNFRHIEP